MTVDWALLGTELAAPGVVGFLVGWGLKKLTRLLLWVASIVVVLIVAFEGYLASLGVITVNYDKLNMVLASWGNTLTGWITATGSSVVQQLGTTALRRDGLCLFVFLCHRFHDTPISFRSDYDSLIVLSAPMNDYDVNFIQSKIGHEGISLLDEAELKGMRGLAAITVRRHLRGVMRFPRYVPKGRALMVRRILQKLKFWT